MNPTSTARGLVRPSYRPPGQAEYVNMDKLELDLENAEWEIQALRLRLGTLKTERDRAVAQVAVRDQTIARLKDSLAAKKANRPVQRQLKPVGRLSLNLTLRKLQFGDQVIHLSPNELDVMAQFFGRPGVILETPEIQHGMARNPSLNSIRAHIWRIRVKLEAAGAGGYLHARHPMPGGGYWLCDPEAPD